MQLSKLPFHILRKISRQFTSLLLFSLLVFTSAAQAENTQPSSKSSLKIGLALGGGGTRGCAHIGVLRVLEREGIPISFIVGTSMGAIVGGLYASGVSLDCIENMLYSKSF